MVDGEHLHILVIATAIDVVVLDPDVRKMDLIIEVRQVMFQCPRADFFLVAVGMPVVVVAVCIVFMQPLLIVALQLVVEDNAIAAGALLFQALRGVQIRVIDLRIVFELSRPFQARVEGLTVPLVGIAMPLQELTAVLREDNGVVAAAGNPNRFDQPLFTKIAEVA